MAVLIAFEGIDGSGKGTQALRLCRRIDKAGLKRELISFPRYADTFFGSRIGDFLNGRFGTLDEVNPLMASLLYAGDRFESKSVIEAAIADNDVVVFDRYVASNVAHQGAKLDGEARRELAHWIERIEFEINGLPRPDLNVLLDLPADVARTLVLKKNARSYTDQATDLQESDSSYLRRVRNHYLEQADQGDNWLVVPCIATEELRTIEEIEDEVWRKLSPMLGV